MHKLRIVPYPFLVALYGVLALAAANAKEVMWVSDLYTPIALSLVVAGAGWVASRAISRNPDVRAVATLIVVLWFSWYGYVQRALVQEAWLYVVSAPAYVIPGYLALLSGIGYLIVKRLPRSLGALTRYLNITSLVLVALPIATLIREGGLVTRQKPAVEHTSDVPHNGDAAHGQPDIYLVVLDKYTGARSLAANYGFDNHAVLNSLRRLGFFIPDAPHANYVHTHLALAALLNWHLLSDRPADLTIDDGALSLDYAAIEDNATWKFLKARGYRFVFFPSAYHATAANRHADLQIPDPRQVTSELEVVWRRTTLAMPIGELWCRVHGCNRRTLPYTPAPPALIDWQFHQLAQLPDSVGPIFAFAHFTVPHEPYVFNADCSYRDPYWPRDYHGVDEPLVKVAYVEQIKCVNRKVLELASTVLAKAARPSIIIFQSDHGHGRITRAFDTLEGTGTERVNERIDPFAAYYLPGHPDGVVYDSITPVNVLPRIFNHYFDAHIPLQSDATFWSTWDEPFKFTRIR